MNQISLEKELEIIRDYQNKGLTSHNIQIKYNLSGFKFYSILKKHNIQRCKRSKYFDLVNKKFGHLLVLKRVSNNKHGQLCWECKCDCGKIIETEGYSLTRSLSTSCGCSRTDNLIIGNKINNLTILKKESKRLNNKRNVTYVVCECDCGNIIEILGSDLLRERKRHCGCKIRTNKKLWKGCGEISGSYIYHIKLCAQKRKLDFNLTPEYLWQLFLKQNRKCALSGLGLNFANQYKKYNGNASLDRIDSSKGYIEGNVQWVDKDINFMKKNISQEKFIENCELISKFYESVGR